MPTWVEDHRAEFRLSPDLALVTDGRGHFRWEPEPPGLYLIPPMTMASRAPRRGIGNAPVIPGVMPPGLDHHRLTRAQLRDLGEFCLDHAPFSRRWLTDLDTTTCHAAEMVNYPVDYRAGVGPRHFWPLVLAACLTHQFLADVDPRRATSEIYPESNITFDTAALRVTDPRELTEYLTGVYSRPLARAVRRAFIDHGAEILPVISLTRGLEADVIAALVPELRVSPTMQVRGVPEAPDWLLDMPVARRVRWTRQTSLLCEVIRLAGGAALPEEVLTAHDVQAAHDLLVSARLDTGLAELDDTEYRHRVATERTVDLGEGPVVIRPVTRPVDLYLLGHRMGICIGSGHYVHALAEGRSVFYTDRLDRPGLAVEFEPGGRLVEAVGPNNATLSPVALAGLSGALSDDQADFDLAVAS